MQEVDHIRSKSAENPRVQGVENRGSRESASLPQTESRIDLWLVPIGSSAVTLPTSYLDIVSDRERQRWRRLRLESDRRRYLVSHVLLRTVLSRTVEGTVEPCRWQFGESENGKPVIAAAAGLPPSLNFNLSHSEQLAVVAVSSTCPVGVDIEPLYRITGPDPTDTVLSPGELTWLRSRPLAARRVDFVRLWTVKEAYAKLLGRGLSLDFASFEVALDPVRMVRTETGGPPLDDLYLETRELQMRDGSYHLSLAAWRPPGGELGVTLHTLDSRFTESHRDDLTSATPRSENDEPKRTW